MIPENYEPSSLESKWQQAWEKARVFRAPDPDSDPKKRPKFYCLSMFPYPSGSIHMGHARNYSIGDVESRFYRMLGYNVLQPIGWDAFGLPAENAALKRGIHPKDWTLQNISQMRETFKSLGYAYDWEREIATCLPEYYRWEQVFFRKFYESGLAYKKTGLVNWCPKCETVLANEQVQEGTCWRCSSPVEQKERSQWYLRTTKYASQLLKDHEQLRGQWPDRVLEMQKNWIGESKGARVLFELESASESIEVFTTRPDTLFGVTFLTLAPGHPLSEILSIAPGAKEKLESLLKTVQARSRTEAVTTKEGFFTGSFVKHPLTGKKIPVWVGDFVVMDYGTGAVMGVPAHDQRDFEFARKYSLSIQVVIGKEKGPLKEAMLESAPLTGSGEFDGVDSETAKTRIAVKLATVKKGGEHVQYRLRDWGISRQRYWGSPIPVIYCDKDGIVLVPEKDLPVLLPDDVSFKDVTGNPLDAHPTFSKTKCPKCGAPARRETDTMDTFFESSWYYLRFLDPKNSTTAFEKKKADFFVPVDTYIGGIEHACMHLLYARFFHKVLRDWGLLSTDEPFKHLVTQGMVTKDGSAMSKSRGNVVTPSSIIEQYGTDTARLFTLFAAPVEKDLEWADKGVQGCYRFLQRVWRLTSQWQTKLAPMGETPKENISPSLLSIRRKTHWMIDKVTSDIKGFKFNTAISACMELVNEVYGVMDKDLKVLETPDGGAVLREAIENLVLSLAPFSPHLSEELWSGLGYEGLVAEQAWPVANKALLSAEVFSLVVQVNGKVRDKMELSKGLSEDDIKGKVLANPKLKPFVDGKTVQKCIYVPERLFNVVVS